MEEQNKATEHALQLVLDCLSGPVDDLELL
jgi:hypothetical protein